MTDTATTDNGKKGKRPSHAAYAVREYGENQKEWLKIGVAWQRTHRILIVLADLVGRDIAVQLVDRDSLRQVGQQRRRRGERQEVARFEIAVDHSVGIGKRTIDNSRVARTADRNAWPALKEFIWKS